MCKCIAVRHHKGARNQAGNAHNCLGVKKINCMNLYGSVLALKMRQTGFNSWLRYTKDCKIDIYSKTLGAR